MQRLILLCLAAVTLVVAGCGSNDSTKTAAIPDDASASVSTPADTTSTPAGTATSTTPTTQDPSLAQKPEVKVPSGPAPKKLVVKDLVVGTGAEAKDGDNLTMDYVGVLYKNGKQFDASWDSGNPFSFQLGGGQVISGWDQGIKGMKVGGRRELIIPPSMGYGSEGSPPAIPADSTLVFVVDLKDVSS
ncbi:MAG: peptidyl-prolyl cis-trans isomerase [Solirubrobacterales bacterium]|jgi:FKBP-type peptidyl-prolyl cis-trans isomerase|nr:peptidyl-prolyl cis-trans isomerase [Solirubrobacterales bacterium]